MLPPPEIQGVYRTDLRARAAYAEAAGIYRILPYAVCLPADTDDLRRLVCWAADHRLSLTPRGGGSGMSGGNVGEGVIVDLTRMAGRRLEVDAERRTAVTTADVTLAELNAAALPYQLRLPPDPSSGRWATVGGMVATNAAGARSVRYGSVREWVDALTLLTSDGDTITLHRGQTQRGRAIASALTRFGREAAPAIQEAAPLIAARFPRTRKNSSGYALDAYLESGDLLDLVIGAEGTLGIVTEVEWRLDPIPPFRAGLRIALRSLDLLGEAVAAVTSCQPSALELLDRTFLDLVGTDTIAGTGLRFARAEAVLLVELERNDGESLRHGLEQITARSRPLADSVDTAFSAAAAERLWAIRHAASPMLARLSEHRRSLQVIEDGCVPPERVADYIRAVRQAAHNRGLDIVMFGHAGDGHIHVNLLPEVGQVGWEAAVASLLDEVTEALIELGGTPSGEHGDGRLRAASLTRVYGTELVELFRRVKHSFDPLGIFNPGIILPSGQPPITRLKVGATAVPLPDDLQHALREIERTGGYGRCRLELAGEVRSQESEVGSLEPKNRS
jgi:FAD/FMN-containing dehydrogenase